MKIHIEHVVITIQQSKNLCRLQLQQYTFPKNVQRHFKD